MIRPEDLGSMGESFFATLCKSTGLIANKSTDDKGGWDYEIEHPRPNSPAYQKQSYPVYRVQVKASSGKKPQVPLTYSNLLNLIQYSGASFIFFLTYTDRIFPDKGYLLHINESFTKEVLFSLRKKHLKNPQLATNKATKIIRFDTKTEISPLDGQTLGDAICKYIGSNYLEYVGNKVQYLSKYEREGTKKSFKITVKGKENIEAMVNSMLGYGGKFKIDCADYHSPYGISDNTPHATHHDFLSTISPVHDERPLVTATFSQTQYGKGYTFSGRIYALPYKLPIPEIKQISRLDLKLFDLILDTKKIGLSLNCHNIFSAEIQSSIEDVYNFLSLFKQVASGSKTYLTLKAPDVPKPVQVSLGSLQAELPPFFEEMHKTLHDAIPHLAFLGLCTKPVLTRNLFEERAMLYLLGTMGKEYDPPFDLPFQCINSEPQSNSNVIIFQSSLHFQDGVYAVLVAFFGIISHIGDDQYQGKFFRSEVLGDYVLNLNDDLQKILETEREKFTKDFELKGFIVG